MNTEAIAVLEKLLRTIIESYPKAIEAMNYAEEKERIVPYFAFAELRDILWHISELGKKIENNDSYESYIKQLSSIEEHFRRAIVETYQDTYEELGETIFEKYSKYRNIFIRFEKVFFLDRAFKETHIQINELIVKSRDEWKRGRNTKSLELNSLAYESAIEHFKNAYDLLLPAEALVNKIWNTFFARSLYSVIFVFLVLIILMLKFL